MANAPVYMGLRQRNHASEQVFILPDQYMGNRAKNNYKVLLLKGLRS